MNLRRLLELVGGLALLAAALLIAVVGDAQQAGSESSPHVVEPSLDQLPAAAESVRPAAPRANGTGDTGAVVHNESGAAAGSGRPSGQDRAGTSASTVHPERIRIPAIGVDADVRPVELTAGDVLDPPANPDVLGWWAGGALPGASRGTSIITGHVNTAMHGPGALVDLDQLEVGDEIVVEGSHRTLSFTVVDMEQHDKRRLPVSTAFRQVGRGRLAIVSCGGPFDATVGSYRDNIIAYAVPDAP